MTVVSVNKKEYMTVVSVNKNECMGQFTDVGLSCYRVLLSTDSKTR